MTKKPPPSLTLITTDLSSPLATKRTVRQFTAEYREQVIRLIMEEKQGVASVSRDLGISESLIYTWLKRFRSSTVAKQGSVNTLLPSKKTVLPADYVAGMAALQRENAQLREERDILKKSLGIFVKDVT